MDGTCRPGEVERPGAGGRREGEADAESHGITSDDDDGDDDDGIQIFDVVILLSPAYPRPILIFSQPAINKRACQNPVSTSPSSDQSRLASVSQSRVT